jgi:mannitol 2-dehydrogenase
MVDRITPATTDADRDLVRTRFGLHDLCPVVCEPYAQWVLQDSFASGRPAFERAGVQVVGDVEPHELLKLRLVNAVHQGLCYLGRLCDYELVHEAAQDPLFQQFLNGYMNEAIHTLPPVAGIDYGDYKALVIERLCNPGIGDTIARLCADGSDRIPKFLLPVVRLQLARGGAIRYSAAIVASWARYAEGADEHGEPIQVVDRRKRHLTALANAQRSDILAFVSNRELFGDLIDHQSFATAYCWALRSLLERGARATLTALVSPTGLHAE